MRCDGLHRSANPRPLVVIGLVVALAAGFAARGGADGQRVASNLERCWDAMTCAPLERPAEPSQELAPWGMRDWWFPDSELGLHSPRARAQRWLLTHEEALKKCFQSRELEVVAVLISHDGPRATASVRPEVDDTLLTTWCLLDFIKEGEGQEHLQSIESWVFQLRKDGVRWPCFPSSSCVARIGRVATSTTR